MRHTTRFTPRRWLNRLIGTIALLPSLHPYSMWVKLHNLRHHRWTNLYPNDDVWTPYDKATYEALPWHSRAMYRFYRTRCGPLLYYLIEFWWKKFTWPTKKHYDGTVKFQYVIDALVVWAFVASYLTLLVWGAGAGWFGGVVRPWWSPVLFGAVAPFLIWNVYSSVVIFLHHTHPRTVWYNDEEEWRQVSKADTSVHAVFPDIVRYIFHFIMEHSAHHLRPAVPLYHLTEAQACLEEKEDLNIIVYRWSPARHSDICRRCKLYDFQAKRWMDFQGNYTSKPPRRRNASPASAKAAAAST